MKFRASQLNGRAICINLDVAEVRENGESEQRIFLQPVSREAPRYGDPRTRRTRLD